MTNPFRLKSVLAGGNILAVQVGIKDYGNEIVCGVKINFKGKPVRVMRTVDRHAGYCEELLPLRTFFLFLDWHLNSEYRVGAISLPYVGKYVPSIPEYAQIVKIFREVWIKCGYTIKYGLADAKDMYPQTKENLIQPCSSARGK